jgi:hypothetical protein
VRQGSLLAMRRYVVDSLANNLCTALTRPHGLTAHGNS